MTLTIPLSVRLSTARQDRHVTRLLRELTFRSVVPGGFASLTMSFDRPLHIQPDEVDYYAGVYVYGPDGNVIWEGRLEDPGRGVSGDGLIWEMAAVGPSAHAEDLTAPAVYIAQSLDLWSVEPGGSTVVDWQSQTVNDQSEPGWLGQYPSGAVVGVNASSSLEFPFLMDNNQYLAKLHYTYQMGVSDANLRLRLFVCDQVCDNPLDVQWTTVKTTVDEVFTTDFTRGYRRPSFQLRRNTALTVPNDTWWCRLTDLIVVAMRYNKDGTLNLTAADYVTSVRAHEVVADVLARLCPRFDGMNAVIVPTTYAIQSLTYVDGATARQILDDMMAYEPAYYWAAWESNRDRRVSKIIAHDTFGRFSNCIADGFVRTVSNTWGQSDSGHTWSDNLGSASERSVSGGQGRIAVASVNGSRFDTVDSGVTDHVIHMEGCFGVATATGDVIRMAAVARFQDTSNYYSCQLELQTNGTVLMSLLKQVAGSQTVLVAGVNIGTNSSANDFWRISLSCLSTSISAIASKAAASTATAQSIVDASLSTGTRAGVRAFLGAANTNTLPVTLRFDHFAIVNGNLGFGTMDSGHTWDWTGGNARHFFVAGGVAAYNGVHVVDTASTQLRQTRTDVGVLDGLFYAKVAIDIGTVTGTPPSTASCIARVVGRSAGVGDFYGAQIVWNTDDSITLEILRVIGGSVVTIAGPVKIYSGFGWGQDVNVILDIDGSLIRAKAWSGTGEPDGFLLSVLDTNITTGTFAGLVSRVNSANTNALPVQFRWKEFKVLGRDARHRFEWTTWPTTVRYEADVTDGFDSPGSGQGLYNVARVRYKDVRGKTLTIRRTQDVQELTDAGLDREAFIDAGSDRSFNDAAQAGDAFLADHKKPPNAGTLVIARPIVDLVQGGMVQPYEIRPGNLIRVRGVLPKVDNLNATDRDGLTVFRIIGMTFRASSGTAELELDSYPLTIAQALAALKRGKP